MITASSASASASVAVKLDLLSGETASAITRVGSLTTTKNVLGWLEGDVAAWLEGIGAAYCKYKAAFIENGINGEMLLADDFGEYLDELGVSSKMHRNRIMKERAKLPR
jgi:hypothetical protein